MSTVLSVINSPGRVIAAVLAFGVFVFITGLNAVFTFTYGMDVVGAFLLTSALSESASMIVSGVVSLFFFDVAYLVGFIVILMACDSVWQYGIVMLQVTNCLILSIVASVVSIIILSPLGDVLPSLAIEVARYLGYAGLIWGFIVNVFSGMGYIATSPKVFAAIRKSMFEATRAANEIALDWKIEYETNRLTFQQVSLETPTMARSLSADAVAQWKARHGQTYQLAESTGPTAPIPSSSTSSSTVSNGITASSPALGNA